MDYMENLRRSPVFRNSFEPSMSMGKEHHGRAGSSPIEVNLPSFAQDMEHLHLPRRHDTSASTLEADDFSSPSAYAPEPFGPKEKKADEMPVLDERQVTIIVLLARVCSVYDATPKTFVANVLRLHRMGVLESIAFLSDLGLLASTTSPRKMDAIEQWDADKGGVNGGILGFPQSLNVSRYARDFDEVRLIGQGGFGQVYMARHKLDGICYAIKQVRFFNKGFQSPLVQNVLREVHCLARCDHPNVNRYYSAWLEPTWVPMNLHATSYAAPPTSAPIINPVELQTKNPHLLEDIYRFVDAKSDSDLDGNTTSNLELSEDHYSSYSMSRDSYESSNGSVVEFEFDRDMSQSNFSCTSFSDLPAYDPKSVGGGSVSVTSSSVHRRRSKSFESSTHASRMQLATYQATHTIVSDWNSVNSVDARTLQLQRKRQQSWCAETPFRNHRAGSFLAIEGDAPPTTEMTPAFTYQITLYIQMFLCEQSTLQDWLDERNRNVGRVDFQTSLRLFRQLVNGIKHVHENGIIHRDLKPSNVFMTRDGALKIGDFGLSKLLAEVMADDPMNNCGFMPPASGHGHTQGVGTMSYASPEQVAGTDYDHKVDSFSLGIILLELFCVFDTKMERARALKDVRGNPPHVPAELATTYPEIAALISHLVAPTCTRWTVEQAHDYLCTTFPQVHLEKAREVLELRQQLHENEAKLKEQDALIEELRRQVAALSQEDTDINDPRMAR
ncbi:PEK/PEK protein kinase [Saprolegnia parasitica CBS 223.65]|uniref:non-specific serine/threonine protein kinase n=1 Tax=Saprolegnia parasitica (strain CBS 223.65) TaxID=695850 RepID=A0A067C1X7_SAPPC|nr:PEK/PEK protein kinase [Saprolegnia parasitica CBS 223.65]KDO24538.1 PEK/PEK protein kinase [Saprolegnia parasitica CBS 223.65]|eukprot:XP_012204799.1 PEK/PEK protein kinase [Saprolegnia parasitica CBS 223.65]